MSKSFPGIVVNRGFVMIALLAGCAIPDDAPLLPEPSRTCGDLTAVALTPPQQARQDEVDSFLAQRYLDEGWVILETTETCVGDRWDWLDAASVPGSEVEPPPLPEIELPPGVELQQTELDLHPELQGPPDSVPMLRPSFAPYVFGDVEASSVEDFLAKSVQSVQGQPAGQNRLYAGINMAAPSVRVQSFISGYDGKVEKTIMSVLEMAVTCQGSDPATTRELVGVAVSRDRWNFDRDVEPAVTRLQVEFLTAGDATGNEVGGWHGRVTGFKPLKGAKYGPGVALTPSSTVGGAILDSLFEIRNIAGTWWVLHNHKWLGHYPAELFDVMTFEACEVHWYGEVHDFTPTSWTSSDLGSGRFASEGLGNAAYFRQPFYEDPAGMLHWPDGAEEATPNDPLCYTSSGLLNQGLLFDRVMYVGGPGGDSPGCN